MLDATATGGGDVLRNAGEIDGELRMGGGDDRVINLGLPTGLADLGAGNDRYEGRGAVGTQVEGGAGRDTLIGLAGDDVLSAGAGNDVLTGGKGDDALSGGAGNDVIRPGPGADVITTGPGADVTVFGAVGDMGNGQHSDTVTDFTPGQDRIDLSGLGKALSFIGGDGFGAVAGQIRHAAPQGRLQGEMDGDGLPISPCPCRGAGDRGR